LYIFLEKNTSFPLMVDTRNKISIPADSTAAGQLSYLYRIVKF